VTRSPGSDEVSGAATTRVLVGPISVDRYLDEDLVLPGGGALNMAYHWSRLAMPFRFITRVGGDETAVVLPFLRRHAIECTAELTVVGGTTASIDITIRDDRQPWMDNFVPGVWSEFVTSSSERSLLTSASHVHAVLVDPVIAELQQLGASRQLTGSQISGDFLSLRHYTIERFAETMRHVHLGFIGWPGEPDDPMVGAIRDVAFELRRLVVVTMGARTTLVFDGRERPTVREYPVSAVPVVGTTVGCGDAFIAAFLASWWDSEDIARAVASGQAAGAAATSWFRPLPDSAYDPEV
jgi:sugar/nucleoside kinase (ribokinase family)